MVSYRTALVVAPSQTGDDDDDDDVQVSVIVFAYTPRTHNNIITYDGFARSISSLARRRSSWYTNVAVGAHSKLALRKSQENNFYSSVNKRNSNPTRFMRVCASVYLCVFAPVNVCV